jgi:hypothetical protein
MATKLFARASIRIAAHKFCTFVLAPTLAHVITDKVFRLLKRERDRQIEDGKGMGRLKLF